MFKKVLSMFQSQPQKPKQNPFDVYLGLRQNVLALDPAQVGITSKEGGAGCWGVVTDLDMAPSGSITLVSLADGTTSMYTSTGGGMLGAGENKAGAPAVASMALVHVAEKYFAKMQPAKEFPLPAAGNVRFYVLTAHGIYTTEFQQLTPADQGHPFFELYAYAQNVVTGLRQLSQQQNQK